MVTRRKSNRPQRYEGFRLLSKTMMALAVMGCGLQGAPSFAQTDAQTDKREALSTGNFSVALELRQFSLADASVRAAVLQTLVQRLIVPLLSDGVTPFPTRSPIFRSSSVSGTGDPVRALIAEAHQKKVSVYGQIDLLRWVPENAARPRNIFVEHPEMAERVLGGSLGNLAQGAYASPFNPSVRQALSDLAAEVAERYPELDGLVLRLCLPAGQFYGFSLAARESCIRAVHYDPVDVGVAPGDEAKVMAGEIANWRLSEATGLMKAVCEAAHRVNPRLNICLTGDAVLYRLEVRDRARSLNDWLAWLPLEGVGEVALEADWNDTDTGDAFSSSALLAEKVGKEVSTTAFVPLRVGRRKVDVVATMNRLAAQGARRVLILLSDPNDIPRLSQIATDWAAASARYQVAAPAPKVTASGP